MIIKNNYINYLIKNNFFLLKIKFKKISNIDYDFDFSNLYFVDQAKDKKIFFRNNNNFNKFDEDFYIYHSFNWIKIAKDTGGVEIVKLTRDKILKWISNNHKFHFYIYDIGLVAKRTLNLIYHYDFYGSSANHNDKKKLKFIIFCHYSFLKVFLDIKTNNYQEIIEIKKIVLLYEAIHKINTKKIINQIKTGMAKDINPLGLHFSMSPQIHAEYINNLIEIKNIFLFFNFKIPKEVQFNIINMISVLKNFIHKDNSLAYFNGSNNFFIKKILSIIKHEKDIKIKNLQNNKKGLLVYENKEIKLIFDVVNPYSKLINYGLHASTLAFELSYNDEKIISNCGSLNKKNKKTPNYFRYSAAHSTIILNNTNITEIVENKSYKRIPKKINFEISENNTELIWLASHDGYKQNFQKIIKRQIAINKKNNLITGKDEIFSIGIKKQKNVFNIRFHLTPICKILLTRGRMSAIIKTNKSSYLFGSDNEITIEESIFVNELNKIVKTSQIVISGSCHNSKKIINWWISKY